MSGNSLGPHGHSAGCWPWSQNWSLRNCLFYDTCLFAPHHYPMLSVPLHWLVPAAYDREIRWTKCPLSNTFLMSIYPSISHSPPGHSGLTRHSRTPWSRLTAGSLVSRPAGSLAAPGTDCGQQAGPQTLPGALWENNTVIMKGVTLATYEIQTL